MTIKKTIVLLNKNIYKYLTKLKISFSKIFFASTILITFATVHYQDTTTKVKIYFCKSLNKITYFHYNLPSQSWGKCYYTLITKDQYAKQKSTLFLDSRIYRNFVVQRNLINTFNIIPLEQ